MALLGFALPPDSGEKLSLGTYNFIWNISQDFHFNLKFYMLPFVILRCDNITFINCILEYGCWNDACNIRCSATLRYDRTNSRLFDLVPKPKWSIFVQCFPYCELSSRLSSEHSKHWQLLRCAPSDYASNAPNDSELIAFSGTYFNSIMFMVASSVVSTILILNYHHRSADTHEMSGWVSGIKIHGISTSNVRMHTESRIFCFVSNPFRCG